VGHLGHWSPYTLLKRQLKGGPLKPKKGIIRKPGQMRGKMPNEPARWTVEVGPVRGETDWLHVQVRTKDQLSSVAFTTMADTLHVRKTKTPGGIDVFTLIGSMPGHVTVNIVGVIEYVGTWPAKVLEK